MEGGGEGGRCWIPTIELSDYGWGGETGELDTAAKKLLLVSQHLV